MVEVTLVSSSVISSFSHRLRPSASGFMPVIFMGEEDLSVYKSMKRVIESPSISDEGSVAE